MIKKWITRFIVRVVTEDLYRNGEIAWVWRGEATRDRKWRGTMGQDDRDIKIHINDDGSCRIEKGPPVVKVHIYGNIVDHEAFARAVVPPGDGDAA